MKKWMIRIAGVFFLAVLTILACVFYGWYTGSRPVLESVESSADEVYIGVAVEYDVIVRAPLSRLPQGNMTIDLPDSLALIESRGPEFEGVGVGTIVWRWGVSVQAFEHGAVEAMPAHVTFTSSRNEPRSFRLAFELPGFDVVPRDADMTGQPVVYAPALPVPLSAVDKTGWWYWLVLMILSLVVLVIVLSILLRKGRSSEDEYDVQLSLWESVLRDLDELERALPMMPEAFFVRVTDILRDYIEQRFDLPASERTTPEFLRDIKNESQFDREQQANLVSVLQFADVVKFGRGDASEERMRSVIDQAREFVAKTRPDYMAERGDDEVERGRDMIGDDS